MNEEDREEVEPTQKPGVLTVILLSIGGSIVLVLGAIGGMIALAALALYLICMNA